MRPKLLYVFSRASRQEQERLVATGESSRDLLYGYLDFERDSWQVEYICRNQDEWSISRRLWFALEWLIARFLRMGFALNIAVDHFRELRRADVIVSTADVVGLPIALFKYLRLVRTPVVYISQGLTDRVEALPEKSFLRQTVRKIYGAFFRSCERILVLGEGARKPLLDLFKLPPEKVHVVPFGVDIAFWSRQNLAAGQNLGGQARSGEYILSVGSDLARDYETLLRAAKDVRLKIVTRLSLSARLVGPMVDISSDYRDEELRALYQNSLFVVIPLHDVTQPSGQSATLQAMACGKAVILTRTRGLWEPSVMRHLHNCYLVEPGNVDDMTRAIAWLTEHPQEMEAIGRRARQTVEAHYTTKHLAEHIEQRIYEAIHRH